MRKPLTVFFIATLLTVAASAAEPGRQTPAPAPAPPAATHKDTPEVEALRQSLESLRSLGSLESLQSLQSLQSLEQELLLAQDANQDRAAEARDRAQEAKERMREAGERAREKVERDADREESLYDRGTSALDDDRYERALQAFDEVVKLNGRRADGALYWKAYTQNKLGQRDAAIASLQTLASSYANSRWSEDAKALRAEIQQSSGQPASPSGDDDELRLLALNSMRGADPDRAVPLLEQFLKSNKSPKLKQQALFVLAQMHSPKAAAVIGQIAKGGANPDLQMRAIKYLGIFGKDNVPILADVYQNTNDVDVKHAILRSFMLAHQSDRLAAAAKSESNADLRADAIRQLGLLRADNELSQLYGTESNTDVKEQILRSLFLAGNADKLAEVAKNEKDARLRMAAIHNLAIMGKRSGDVLTGLYANEKDPDAKHELIKGLFIQQNCKGLVDAARKETDPAMKKDIVQKLSVMRGCKEATDYMMEILK